MLTRYLMMSGVALLIAALLASGLTALQAAPDIILTLIVDRDDNAPGLPCDDLTPNDCTLRSAVQIANTDGFGDYINFSDGDHTIILTATLVLSESGTSMGPELGDSQVIKINANGVGQAFQIWASNIGIYGLNVYGSSAGASNIWIRNSAKNVIIANNVIGASSSVASCPANSSYGGIYINSTGVISPGEARAWIFGNTIRCHAGGPILGGPGDGIDIIGSDNVKIGVDRFGNANSAQVNRIWNNAGDGVHIEASGATSNTVRNSNVAGNRSGVYLYNASRNIIMGNGISNNQRGIELRGGAANNQIGCPRDGPSYNIYSNIVYGNNLDGILISDPATHDNTVYCNWIGLDVGGAPVAPNNQTGVHIDNGAYQNRIGNSTSDGNVISGNATRNVLIAGGAMSNTVAGNYIGTNVNGNGVISATTGFGLDMTDGANRNRIGGLFLTTTNTIGGHQLAGVHISGTTTTSNSVFANGIGVNIALALPVPNAGHGVWLENGTRSNGLLFNVIGHNGLNGVYVYTSTGNAIVWGKVFNNGAYGVLFDANGPHRVGDPVNVVQRSEIYGNALDGIGTRNGAVSVSWSLLSTHDNGGLAIDRVITSDSSNDVTAPYPVITSVNASTGLISGMARPLGAFDRTVVEVYRVALDPSGFGEGITYVGNAATDALGNWALTDATLPTGCYTAFATTTFGDGVDVWDEGSTEFGPNSCRALLPLIQRSP